MRSNPYQQENLRQGAFHYLIGRGAAGAAGFFTILLLVRFMDVHNYAAYTALSGLVAMCGVLASLGLERVVSRYVPEARLYRSVDELSRFIWITSAVRLLAALFIVALLYVLWPAIDRFLTITDFKVFTAGLACFIVAESMFQHFSSVLQSLVMQKVLTRLLVIQWAGRLLLIAIVVFMKSGIDWQDSLWIFAIPELLGVFVFVVVIKRHLQCLGAEHHELTNGPWPQWGKVAEIGMHNCGFTLLAAPPQGYFMKIIAAAYLPVEVVAAYGFFLSVAEKARQYIPLHFFYGMLEPIMVAGYLKDRDFSKLNYRCQLLYMSNLLLMVPAIVWVAVAGTPLVELMTGGKFQGLSWILLLVMVQFTIGSHVVLLQLILNSLEKSKFLIAASLVALSAMLSVMAVSAVTKPIWLLCTPILFSLVMNLYIVFYLARSNHPYKPSWKMLGGVSFSGLVAYAVIKTLTVAFAWSTTSFVMAVSTLLGVTLVYLIVIWLSKAIDQSEIDLIKGIVLSIRRGKEGSSSPSPVHTTRQSTAASMAHAEDIWGGRQLIHALQDKARTVLDTVIPAGSSVALLDYPNYYNVGDSMIWLGEINYLRSRNLSPQYVCDIHNYNPERLRAALDSNPVILLQGGGNFGTLWSEIQDFRLKVLRDFPDVPVVQLPQSLHFENEKSLKKAASAIRSHGKFTLLVRDHVSHEFASKHFDCPVLLCPDMAFFIGQIASDVSPQFDRFILSRTDHEKFSNWHDAPSLLDQKMTVEMDDWLQAGWRERLLSRFESHTASLRRLLDPNNRCLLILWNRLAHARMNRGKAMLQGGRVLISDRLHAHVLAILLNKPHVLIDNVYGKLGNLHAAWTTPYRGVHFVHSLAEAFDAAAVLDSGSTCVDRAAMPRVEL